MSANEKGILYSIMLRHAQKDVQDTLRDVYDESYTGFLLLLIMLDRPETSKVSVTVLNKKFSSLEEMKKSLGSAQHKETVEGKIHQTLMYHFDGKKGCKLLRNE